jgi:transcriptional regulator with XRE-family HTH domain
VSKGKQRERDLVVLGQAIGQVRAERGVSTSDLAAAAGNEQTLIEALEGGRVDPSYELLLALADGLGVGPSSFVIRAEELKTQDQASGEAAGPDWSDHLTGPASAKA